MENLIETQFILDHYKYVFHNAKGKVNYKAPKYSWSWIDYDKFISKNNIKFIVTHEYSNAYVNMLTPIIPKVIVLTEIGGHNIQIEAEGELIKLYY